MGRRASRTKLEKKSEEEGGDRQTEGELDEMKKKIRQERTRERTGGRQRGRQTG